MKSEVLTPGEKIKKLRKYLRVKQKDIMGNDGSISSLSMIEHGNMGLTFEMAVKIADSINTIAKEKNAYLDNEVTADYLTESQDVQCNRIANEYLSELIKLKPTDNIEKFNYIKTEIEEFINKYDSVIFSAIKCEINYFIAKKYCDKHIYNEAYIYAIKAYNCSSSTTDNISSLIKCIALIIEIGYKLNHDEEIMGFGSIALAKAKEYKITDNDTMAAIYYNLAYAHKKVKKYSECLDYISRILVMKGLEIKRYVDAKILKANCYTELEDYKSAENCNLSILEELKHRDDIDSSAKIYKSLAYIYIKSGNIEEALHYSDLLVDIESMDNSLNADNFYYATYIYKEADNFVMVNRYFIRALDKLYAVKKIKDFCDLALECFNYYLKGNHKVELKEFAAYIIKVLKEKKINDIYNSSMVGILYKLAFYLQENSENHMAQQIYNIASSVDEYNK